MANQTHDPISTRIDFPVAAGDRLECIIYWRPYHTDPVTGEIDPQVEFDLHNYTQNEFETVVKDSGDGAAISGHVAQAIIERPKTAGGTLTDLTQFGKLDVSSAVFKEELPSGLNSKNACMGSFDNDRYDMYDFGNGNLLASPRWSRVTDPSCAFRVTRTALD